MLFFFKGSCKNNKNPPVRLLQRPFGRGLGSCFIGGQVSGFVVQLLVFRFSLTEN